MNLVAAQRAFEAVGRSLNSGPGSQNETQNDTKHQEVGLPGEFLNRTELFDSQVLACQGYGLRCPMASFERLDASEEQLKKEGT